MNWQRDPTQRLIFRTNPLAVCGSAAVFLMSQLEIVLVANVIILFSSHSILHTAFVQTSAYARDGVTCKNYFTFELYATKQKVVQSLWNPYKIRAKCVVNAPMHTWYMIFGVNKRILRIIRSDIGTAFVNRNSSLFFFFCRLQCQRVQHMQMVSDTAILVWQHMQCADCRHMRRSSERWFGLTIFKLCRMHYVWQRDDFRKYATYLCTKRT